MKTEIALLLNNYSSAYDIENNYKDRMLAFLDRDLTPFSRENAGGHFTASAWVLSEDHACVLLTKHAKLGKWFQLGGHIESSDISFMHACLREVTEESGIALSNANHSFLIDIDIHPIPKNPKMPEHLHYDITLCFVTSNHPKIACSEESLQLSWVPLDKIPELSQDAAVLRMVAKTRQLQHTPDNGSL